MSKEINQSDTPLCQLNMKEKDETKNKIVFCFVDDIIFFFLDIED